MKSKFNQVAGGEARVSNMDMALVRMDDKSRIVIPKRIRLRLGMEVLEQKERFANH